MLISIGAEDSVIPWGVVEELTKAFRQGASQVRLDVFGGVAHKMPAWLPNNKQICKQLVEYLVDTT